LSCNKLVETNIPPTSLSRENVYKTDATAIAVVTGIYTTLSASGSFATGNRSISVRCGLSADELSLFSNDQNYRPYYLNSLTSDANQTFWESFFNYILKINSAIEGLSNSVELTPSVKDQLLGESKFLRAFIYFYLVNLYGDVPLITSSDYRVNSILSRNSKSDVFQLIIADLKDAQQLLAGIYVGANAISKTNDRVRPNKSTATSLLARAYLYLKDWKNSELEASSIINDSSVYKLVPLNSTFLKNSTEAIWQLQPVNAGWNTEDARIFILPSGGPSSTFPVYLDSNFVKAFEVNDLRKDVWVKSVTTSSTKNYFYPSKYKSATNGAAVTEYLMAFRLAEQYLIRAEARAQQGDILGSQSDLNRIRNRAGLNNTMAGDKVSLVNAIFNERRYELFTEWGHRWLDMKRSNQVDSIMDSGAKLKGSIWNANWSLYPLPLYDIQQNENLIQNPGY
jgi:hypothetical protein